MAYSVEGSWGGAQVAAVSRFHGPGGSFCRASGTAMAAVKVRRAYWQNRGVRLRLCVRSDSGRW